MRRTLVLLILLTSFLFFGCITQKDLTSYQKEKLVDSHEVDLDGDGSWDYAVYTFAPVKIEGEDLSIQRRLFVSVKYGASFSSFNNLSDYSISQISEEFGEFVQVKEASVRECSSSLGLISAICIDPKTCAKLCSASSSKCSEMVDKYENVLGDSVKSFVKNNDEVANEVVKISNKIIPQLKSRGKESQKELAEKLMSTLSHIALINAELIYSHPSLQLCQPNDYGASRIKIILDQLGAYTTTPLQYSYISTIEIKTTTNNSKNWQPKKLTVKDTIIKSDINIDTISSVQLDPQFKTLSISSTKDNISLSWDSIDPYQKGSSIVVFAFSSAKAPTTFIPGLLSPATTIKTIDMTMLLPTILFYNVVLGISRNPLFALGVSISITLIIIVFLFNLLVILFSVLTALAAGEKITTGIHRAVAKTRLQWRSDIIISVILIVAAVVINFYLTTPPKSPLTFFEAVDYLFHLTEYPPLIGFVAISFGLFIFYLAVENKLKVSFLEREYGQKIKEERDLFAANVQQLKSKLAELKNTADLLSSEGINVSREYELVEEHTPERIEKLAKKMDSRSKQALESSLFDVDSALQHLNEKKKLIADNWQRWSESISNALGQSDEVHTTALVSIPASLRIWALVRYAREHQQEGFVYENEMLRRKFVQPDKIVKDMINKGLLVAGVLVKDGKVLFANVEKGSSTVAGVLTIKLINYALSAVKKLGQHTYGTIAAVGDRLVLVLIRSPAVDALLFIEKNKFKDTVEEWKRKLKLIEKLQQ